MRVIVVCEQSGVVRRAFAAAGHEAYSCDIEPAEDGSPNHIKADCLDLDYSGYDLAICHPPCTHLAASGARWWPEKQREQAEAIEFVKFLADIPVSRVAIENPVGKLSTAWRKPDQIVQPWMFGDAETKTTCWWLRGLPLLRPTDVVEPEYHEARNGKSYSRIHFVSGRLDPAERRRIRSRSYGGMARAMAAQWGST